MAKRLLKDKLVPLSSIKEEMKLIDGSNTDYITPSGKVYKLYFDDMYYPKKTHVNNKNGYVYVGITFSDGKNKSRRLHVLMAKAFIPNYDPEHLKIVGHKDDNKQHNELSNLYWTDTRENTQSAVNHNLCNQPKAEKNKNSIHVKVIDKNTNRIVGVYGSYRECARCIENISVSMIARMCQKNDIYSPRTKKYIYQHATKEEFENNYNLRSVRLIENQISDKSPKVFYLINDSLNYKEKFDNQTQASKICNISQSIISKMIREGIIINGWRCAYIDTITYKEASSYQNFMNTVNQIILKHIKTNEIKIYNSFVELKKDFGINGHDIKQYFNTGNTLMNEWKIIDITDKTNQNYNIDKSA